MGDVLDGIQRVGMHPLYCNTKAGVDIDIIFEYESSYKGEEKMFEFIGNLATRSIIGKKSKIKTNRLHILARMLGQVSFKGIPDELTETQVEIVNWLYDKSVTPVTRKRHMRELLDRLQVRWGLIVYSTRVRGYWFSYKGRMTYKQLGELAKEMSIKAKIKALNDGRKGEE